MTDIVDDLRQGICEDKCRVMTDECGCACAKAADEIERLREALQDIADQHIPDQPMDDACDERLPWTFLKRQNA